MIPKSMKAGELIKIIQSDGWKQVPSKGGHLQFRHPIKMGRVTIPIHSRDIKPLTVKSILKQAGLL